MGNIDGKRPLWSNTCERKIEMDPEEVQCEDVDWAQLSTDRLQWRDAVNAITDLQVH
jgi:hypothetical protein